MWFLTVRGTAGSAGVQICWRKSRGERCHPARWCERDLPGSPSAPGAGRTEPWAGVGAGCAERNVLPQRSSAPARSGSTIAGERLGTGCLHRGCLRDPPCSTCPTTQPGSSPLEPNESALPAAIPIIQALNSIYTHAAARTTRICVFGAARKTLQSVTEPELRGGTGHICTPQRPAVPELSLSCPSAATSSFYQPKPIVRQQLLQTAPLLHSVVAHHFGKACILNDGLSLLTFPRLKVSSVLKEKVARLASVIVRAQRGHRPCTMQLRMILPSAAREGRPHWPCSLATQCPPSFSKSKRFARSIDPEGLLSICRTAVQPEPLSLQTARPGM